MPVHLAYLSGQDDPTTVADPWIAVGAPAIATSTKGLVLTSLAGTQGYGRPALPSDLSTALARPSDRLEMQAMVTGSTAASGWSSASGASPHMMEIDDGERALGVAIGATLHLVDPYTGAIVQEIAAPFPFTSTTSLRLVKRESASWDLYVDGQLTYRLPYKGAPASTRPAPWFGFGAYQVGGASVMRWSEVETAVNASVAPHWKVARARLNLPAPIQDAWNERWSALVRAVVGLQHTASDAMLETYEAMTGALLWRESARFSGALDLDSEADTWNKTGTSAASRMETVRQRLRITQSVNPVTARHVFNTPMTPAEAVYHVRATVQVLTYVTDSPQGRVGPIVSIANGHRLIRAVMLRSRANPEEVYWALSDGTLNSALGNLGALGHLDPTTPHVLDVYVVERSAVVLALDGCLIDVQPYETFTNATADYYAEVGRDGANDPEQIRCVVELEDVTARVGYGDSTRRPWLNQRIAEQLVFAGGCESNALLQVLKNHMQDLHRMRGTLAGITHEVRRLACDPTLTPAREWTSADWYVEVTWPEETPIFIEANGFVSDVYVEFTARAPNFAPDELGALIQHYILPISTVEAGYHAVLYTLLTTATNTAGAVSDYDVDLPLGFASGDLVTLREERAGDVITLGLDTYASLTPVDVRNYSRTSSAGHGAMLNNGVVLNGGALTDPGYSAYVHHQVQDNPLAAYCYGVARPVFTSMGLQTTTSLTTLPSVGTLLLALEVVTSGGFHPILDLGYNASTFKGLRVETVSSNTIEVRWYDNTGTMRSWNSIHGIPASGIFICAITWDGTELNLTLYQSGSTSGTLTTALSGPIAADGPVTMWEHASEGVMGWAILSEKLTHSVLATVIEDYWGPAAMALARGTFWGGMRVLGPTGAALTDAASWGLGSGHPLLLPVEGLGAIPSTWETEAGASVHDLYTAGPFGDTSSPAVLVDGDTPSVTAGLTISACVLWYDNNGVAASICASEARTPNGWHLYQHTDGALHLDVWSAASALQQLTVAAGAFTDGVYHNVAAVITATHLHLYVDGVAAATAALAIVPGSPGSGGVLWLGSSASATPWRSDAYDLWLWERDLSAGEVDDLHNGDRIDDPRDFHDPALWACHVPRAYSGVQATVEEPPTVVAAPDFVELSAYADTLWADWHTRVTGLGDSWRPGAVSGSLQLPTLEADRQNDVTPGATVTVDGFSAVVNCTATVWGVDMLGAPASERFAIVAGAAVVGLVTWSAVHGLTLDSVQGAAVRVRDTSDADQLYVVASSELASGVYYWPRYLLCGPSTARLVSDGATTDDVLFFGGAEGAPFQGEAVTLAGATEVETADSYDYLLIISASHVPAGQTLTCDVLGMDPTGVIELVSDDAADTMDAFVFSVDASLVAQVEQLTLTGLTPVLGSLPMRRLLGVWVASPAAGVLSVSTTGGVVDIAHGDLDMSTDGQVYGGSAFNFAQLGAPAMRLSQPQSTVRYVGVWGLDEAGAYLFTATPLDGTDWVVVAADYSRILAVLTGNVPKQKWIMLRGRSWRAHGVLQAGLALGTTHRWSALNATTSADVSVDNANALDVTLSPVTLPGEYSVSEDTIIVTIDDAGAVTVPALAESFSIGARMRHREPAS